MRLEDSFLGEFTRYSRALVGLGAASGSNNAQLVHATDETDDSELEVTVSDEGSVDSSEDEGDVDADGENEADEAGLIHTMEDEVMLGLGRLPATRARVLHREGEDNNNDLEEIHEDVNEDDNERDRDYIGDSDHPGEDSDDDSVPL